MKDVVRAFLPLWAWHFQKIFGPIFTPTEWREFALSFVPPPDNVSNVITKECAEFDSPALISSSARRRLRKVVQAYMRHQLRDDPYVLPVRGFFLKWRRQLEEKGFTGDVSRVPKWRDIEAQVSSHFLGLFKGEELPEELKPVAKSHPDALSLMWELAICGPGRKPKLRQNATLFGILGLKPDQLQSASLEDFLSLIFPRVFALGGLNGTAIDETKIVRLARLLVKLYLPAEEEPNTTPGALNQAIQAGLIHKPIMIKDDETGEVVGMDVKDTGADQLGDLSEAEGNEAIIEALAQRGVSYDDLSPKEWAEIFERNDLMRKGYELSSKKGVSIRSFYGDAAHAKEQKWSRIKKKILKLSK